MLFAGIIAGPLYGVSGWITFESVKMNEMEVAR